jgi:hypothetical protein
VDAEGRVVGVVHGENVDDPRQAVAVPVERVRALLAKAKARPREL